MRSPYLMRTIGIGMQATARNANNELPQPYPMVAYILGAARGITAAITDRRIVVAAKAEAAKMVYASTR